MSNKHKVNGHWRKNKNGTKTWVKSHDRKNSNKQEKQRNIEKPYKLQNIDKKTKEKYLEIWSYIHDGYTHDEIKEIMETNQKCINNATVWAVNYASQEELKGW